MGVKSQTSAILALLNTSNERESPHWHNALLFYVFAAFASHFDFRISFKRPPNHMNTMCIKTMHYNEELFSANNLLMQQQ